MVQTGVAAVGGSAPGRQPATAHVQPRLTHDNLLLHLQHELGQRNRIAVGNVLRMMTQGSSHLATLGFVTQPRGSLHLHHDLPLGAAFFEIGQCVLRLSERKHLVYHWPDRSRFEKLADLRELPAVWMHEEK